jgi:hypothetical protein
VGGDQAKYQRNEGKRDKCKCVREEVMRENVLTNRKEEDQSTSKGSLKQPTFLTETKNNLENSINMSQKENYVNSLENLNNNSKKTLNKIDVSKK